jgi:hypothetical protein
LLGPKISQIDNDSHKWTEHFADMENSLYQKASFPLAPRIEQLFVVENGQNEHLPINLCTSNYSWGIGERFQVEEFTTVNDHLCFHLIHVGTFYRLVIYASGPKGRTLILGAADVAAFEDLDSL